MHCLVILSWLFSSFIAQNEPIAALATAIRHADARAIAANFSPSVDVTINGAENIYSAAQAELVLADFFKHNPPKNVQVLHQLNSSSNYHFVVFTINAATGNFRAAFTFKNTGGHFMLNEIRIEPEKSK